MNEDGNVCDTKHSGMSPKTRRKLFAWVKNKVGIDVKV